MTVDEAIEELKPVWVSGRSGRDILEVIISVEQGEQIAALLQHQQAQLRNISALLVDDYSESKDWQAGDVVERVRWLQVMFNAKKEEVEQQQQQIEQLHDMIEQRDG